MDIARSYQNQLKRIGYSFVRRRRSTDILSKTSFLGVKNAKKKRSAKIKSFYNLHIYVKNIIKNIRFTP